MSESYFQLDARDQAAALAAGAATSGRPPHLLEKDIWVVWSLSTLFESELGTHLVFKGGTALSKAYKVIQRFSEDVDLTYDIRALAPDLVTGVPNGIDAIPTSRSQTKRWSDLIRNELLPAWIKDQAQPIIQAGLEKLGLGICRITDDCIFIDYPPESAVSGYALPRVKLEFGARSSGEPSTILPVRCDLEEFVPQLEFPSANPRVMNVSRIFWEKATAAHVYCLQAGEGLSERFSRHFHDLARLNDGGYLASAIGAKDVAEAVAVHKNAFFVEKDSEGQRIDYLDAIRAGLTLVPVGSAYNALREDYQRMVADGLLLDDTETFEDLMAYCLVIQQQMR
ncbi:MAG: nucleotidyl transferase AbiEii/AbiGii toxin family protein [Edaphobacter sp.]